MIKNRIVGMLGVVIGLITIPYLAIIFPFIYVQDIIVEGFQSANLNLYHVVYDTLISIKDDVIRVVYGVE